MFLPNDDDRVHRYYVYNILTDRNVSVTRTATLKKILDFLKCDELLPVIVDHSLAQRNSDSLLIVRELDTPARGQTINIVKLRVLIAL